MSYDYNAKVASRIISQYRYDTVMRDITQGFATLINTEFEAPYDIVKNMMSIDDMEGAQLDIIGAILVQPRPVVTEASTGFFGYVGTIGATPYGVAPYFDYATTYPYAPMIDTMYRRLLKAKAIKNSTKCTADDIFQAAEILGEVPVSRIIQGDMTFSIEFTEILDAYGQILLDDFDVIPQPQGVRFTGWSYL